jgi:predicted dehydrogenase
MMKAIGVGIVGCGRISDLHAIGYQGSEDARIVAVCDSNKRRAADKAREWHADYVYSDYAELLKNPEVDMV